MGSSGARERTGIRPATAADAPTILALYAPIVRDTHISFEVEPPSEEEIRRRMEVSRGTWLVWEAGEEIAGFASSGPFRERAAYRWTAETSIYVAESARRRGVGRSLGEAILEELRSEGYRSAIGVVALPNPGSEGLMKALGFQAVGVIRDAGFKLDRWWDVELWQRHLSP